MATGCGKPNPYRNALQERSQGYTRLQRRLLIAAFIGSAIAMVLLSSISAEAGGVQAAPNLNPLFYEANNHYENGQFAEAAGTYEEILRTGYTSGNLYYNLANAYYRNGQEGLALLNYLRAKRLIPRDPDLRANLDHVRNELQLPEDSSGLMQWLAEKITNWFSVRELVAAGTVCFTTLTLAILLWVPKPVWKRWIRLAAALSVLGLVLAMGGVGLAALVFSGDRAVVVVEEAVVRFEPAASGATHYTLSEGSSVVIEDSREDWVQVRRPDGKKGWVSAEDVQEMDIALDKQN